MPDCVAHYQFGQDILNRLDADLRSRALAYKREYDTGLQGPDLFYFYQPYRKTDVSDYGTACHEQPAIRMFIPILAEVREKAALSYMMGLICHYTLDACCHPYIDGHSRDISDHHRMEAAYDRHILSRCGSVRSRHLLVHTSGLDLEAIASLWPGMDAGIISRCLKSRRFYTWLLDHKGLILVLETVAGKHGAFSPISLPSAVSPEQREHARRLDELYSLALDEAPERMRRACAAMGTRPRELAGFNMNYGGETGHEPVGEELDTLRCG
ncbi:MAG: zinc dependent phospholipase C family protein [Firmicutes bacterium]|nr:zinc dependent phospholipase C family protein [Bacillota bacterium]